MSSNLGVSSVVLEGDGSTKLSQTQPLSLTTWSPISTLERQSYWEPQNSGHRVLFFIRANANCCFPGGVNELLKQQKHLVNPQNTFGAGPTERDFDVDGSHGNSTSSITAGTANDADAFSFLNDPPNYQETTPSALAQQQREQSKKGPNIGRFFKKVALTTSLTLERSIQNLAIRADQGRNPDFLTLALYDAYDQMLGMTESQPIREDLTERFTSGVHFVMPLAVSKLLYQLPTVTIKVWIHSGAALLQSTKAAKKYLLGTTQINLQQLQKLPCFLNSLPVYSNIIVDGQLDILAMKDPKFSVPGARGWSLSDPDQSIYRTRSLFNLPVDQSYAFTLPSRPRATLVATERSTESTVVLPVAAAVAQFVANATNISLQLAQTTATRLSANRHDVALGLYGACTINVAKGLKNFTQAIMTPVILSVTWQRPDSIFEVDLMHPMRLVANSNLPYNGAEVQAISFYPKPCWVGVLPALWQAYRNAFPSHGFFLGNLRLQVTIPKSQASPVEQVWDCIISLDTVLADPTAGYSMKDLPLLNAAGQPMATIGFLIELQMQQGAPVPANPTSAAGGLVSAMGLPRLVDFIQPSLDYDFEPPQQSDADLQRRQQLATMGNFVTASYLEQHVLTYRMADFKLWEERASLYRAALEPGQDFPPPPHQDRTPRAFRPSSSRPDPTLAGLAFNVHNATLSYDIMEAGAPDQGAVFHNMTCGAPSDHVRGFGNIFPKSNPKEAYNGVNPDTHAPLGAAPSVVGAVTGGLRRLEAKRFELAALISNLQTTLTMSIANYFVEQRQLTRKPVYHVSSRHPELAALRWQLLEAVQALHHLTWICAVRRAACFSQALGVALSAYLCSLSDPDKWQTTWPTIWSRHGFLVSFEGLLSAAGKELGMIEDASSGIAMLSMVKVVLVPDDGNAAPLPDSVPVPGSPYLRWIRIQPSGRNPEMEYTLQVGMLRSYYDQRIPASLKNGTPVRLYPLLFEVGVDIRQWGAHAGSNMMKNTFQQQQPSRSDGSSSNHEPTGGLIDDEDDDVGITDDDMLVQLNHEAFQKLNAYAFAVSPANSESSSGLQKKIHPMLETLYQHIVSSAGRINLDIVDEAATLAQQLGGGGVVFCKSGKDRTAMHITYKQAQFVSRFRHAEADTTLAVATLMREWGTRLPICEKNVGQAKYAFNSLQVKFMPEALKPPLSTLAGFLKGGKVFSGGGIES